MSESAAQKAKYEESPAPATPVSEATRAETVEPRSIEPRSMDRQFLDYFGLHEQPFGVTPDLRFLYLGPKHQQALDALNYGTELNRGFLTLIAEPGMGKTSLLFHYLEGLRDKARTVYLFQTDCNATELMRYLLADLGLDGFRTELPEMRSMLNEVLLAELQAGRRFVLVVDEAQNLDEKVLESIRLLSNFETPWMKLIHIVLAGQPQLAERLAQPSLAQLRQRVSLAIRIEPFNRNELDLYIDHRLWVSGFKGTPLFSVGARNLIAERSGGIPRNINNICFCAMSSAWAIGQKTISRELMSAVLAELHPGSAIPSEAIAVKSPVEPTIVDTPTDTPETPAPSTLTIKAEPPASGLPKVIVATLILVAAGWFGSQMGLGKRIAPSFHGLSAALRSLILAAPTHAQQPPAVSRPDPTPNPNTDRLSEDRATDVPPQDAAPSPGSGHN